MKFWLNYSLGDNTLTKEFTSMDELERFLNKLCEIKQIDSIFLDGCEYSIKDKEVKKQEV